MGPGARRGRQGEAAADLDALDGVDAHHGLGQEAVQLAVPHDVGAEADGHAGGPHLERAAEGVPGLAGGVDGPHHPLGRLGVGAADGRLLHRCPVRLTVDRGDDLAYGDGVGVYGDAELLQQATADGAYGNAGGCLAGGGALQDVARVVEAVLHGAREVGVAGAEAGHPLDLALERLGLHHLAPVLPIAVADEQGQGAAQGEAVADAGGDLGVVVLDLLSLGAAVAALAAPEVALHVLLGQWEAGGQPLHYDGEALAVGLAGGKEAKFRHRCDCTPRLWGSGVPASSSRSMGRASPRSPRR